MNQGFKLRYDQMRDSDPTPSDTTTPSTQTGIHQFYSTPGHTRNICLIWPDNRRLFLNYAYLIAGEFMPDSEKNIIKLSFSSHEVILYGYRLERLFDSLQDHQLRFIIATDYRYITNIEDEAIVIEIRINEKEN